MLEIQVCSKCNVSSNIFKNSFAALNVRIKVALSDDEPIENAFKRFKKVVNQSGHLVELRFKEHWENAHDKRKRKAERAQVLNKIERANDRYEKRLETGNDYN